MMKKLLLILIPSVLLLSSCESDEPSRIEVNQEDLNLTLNDEGEKVFTFKTTDSWTVSVTDTSSVEWLSLSHLRGGKGENSIEIKAAPNNTFADRRALLTVKSGNSQFTVGVLQEFGNAVTDIDIPDKAFREYCIKNFDVNEDGLVSYKEVKDVKELSFFYEYYREIKSLVGIEYFTNLERLNCTQQNLMELDLSKNTELTEVYCSNNSLKELKLGNLTELRMLSCHSNSLSALDLSGTKKLTTLNCSFNSIADLDVSDNTSLETIYCHENKLTSLDVSGCTSLTNLICKYNLLTTVNTSGCEALSDFDCRDNRITALDLTSNISLSYLFCYRNQLSTLDLTANKNIWSIACYGNPNLREVWIAKDNTPYINKDSHTSVIYK